MQKRFPVIIILLFVLSAATAYSVELNIVYWGDFHSTNLPGKVNINGQEIQTGGAALLSGMINNLRQQDPTTLFLNTGNDFSGTPVSSLTKGLSQVKILNQIGIDAFLPGASEFDYGWNSLKQVMQDAEFEVLLTNVYEKDTGNPLFNPHTILRRNGVDIAIIGLINPEFTKAVIREGVIGLEVTDYTDSVKTFIEKYRNQADLLIGMSQLGWEKDSLLAMQAPGLDVIIGGGDNIDIYPPKIINSTIISQVRGYGQSIGRLVLTVDTTGGRVWNYEGEIIKPVRGLVQPDEETEKLVKKLEKKYTRKLDKTIGKLVTDWNVSRTEPSNLAQWIADAMHSIAPSVNLALINNGSIGSGLKRGDILERNVWEICPNETPVVVFQITGQELIYMVSRQLRNKGEFLTWSGMKLLTIDGKVKKLDVAGYPVTDFDEFSVITTGFVWDHLYTLTGIRPMPDNRPHFYVPGNQRDFLIEIIKNHKVISTSLDNRWEIR